jgi:LysM repeat protein
MKRSVRLFCVALFLLTSLIIFAAPAATASAQCTGVNYTVQRGDSLLRIAAGFGTTWQAIASANNLYNPNLIFPGQVLFIPTSCVPPPTVPPPTVTPMPPAPPTPPIVGTWYTVRPGDTLQTIAWQFGTTWQAIAQANGIVNPNLIFAGQVLFIPAAPVIFSYIVQPGDTLSSIAWRFGTTVNAIMAQNNIANPNRIYAGQLLYIPVY